MRSVRQPNTERYHDEVRVYLGNPERKDLTLKLWIDMIEEDRNREPWSIRG